MKFNRILILFIVCFSIACSRKIVPANNSIINLTEFVDYSKKDNWAAHPYKKDPSDSVPEPLLKEYVQDTAIDIFSCILQLTLMINW